MPPRASPFRQGERQSREKRREEPPGSKEEKRNGEHIPVPRASTHRTNTRARVRVCMRAYVPPLHTTSLSTRLDQARVRPHTRARARVRTHASTQHACTHAYALAGEDKTGRVEGKTRWMGVGARHKREEGRTARVFFPFLSVVIRVFFASDGSECDNSPFPPRNFLSGTQTAIRRILCTRCVLSFLDVGSIGYTIFVSSAAIGCSSYHRGSQFREKIGFLCVFLFYVPPVVGDERSMMDMTGSFQRWFRRVYSACRISELRSSIVPIAIHSSAVSQPPPTAPSLLGTCVPCHRAPLPSSDTSSSSAQLLSSRRPLHLLPLPVPSSFFLFFFLGLCPRLALYTPLFRRLFLPTRSGPEPAFLSPSNCSNFDPRDTARSVGM